MKLSLILLFTFLMSFGCVFQKGKVIVSGNRKNSANSTISRASVSSVQIINHQLVIHGAGLTDVTNVKVDGNSLAQNFSIESKSATQIIANSIHAFSFDVSKVFNLILSDANAAATFAIDFSLCNSTLNGRGFDCAIAANDRDVLSYDAVSQTWKPRNVNGLNFTGVLPVNGIILETFLQSNVPTSSAVNGDYYIVSGAGGFLRPASGAADLAVSNGDWLSYSDSNTWQVVKNGKNGVASFKGRIGAVVPNSGDYSLHMLSDVDDSSKNDKYVLTYTTTGTPRWIASPILPASTVNATSIVTGTVTGGTGTGNLAANTVTGGGATGNIKQDTITNTEINSAAAIDLAKLGNLPASFVGVPVTTQTNLAIGNTVQQAFQQLALIPQDYVSKSTSVANQLLNGKYDFSGASYLHAPTPLAPYVGTTEVATTAYVINYAATLGQWILGGAGAIGYTAGNVGIGTTAPGALLDIVSNSATNDAIYFTQYANAAAPSLALQRALGSSGTPLAIDAARSLGGVGFSGYDGSAMGLGFSIAGISDGAFTTSNHSSHLIFNATSGTTSSEVMRIASTGNVGIGSTVPAAKLDVAGEVKFGNTSSTCNAANEGQQRYNSTSKNMEFCNGTSWAAIGASSGVPSGSISAYGGTTAPTGWLLCDGSLINRTTYAALFAVIGTAYGSGDGSTTFALPDTRGLFLRGVTGATANDPDAASRTASGAGGNTGVSIGSLQVDGFKSHTHSFTRQSGWQYRQTGGTDFGVDTAGQTTGATGGNETRPKNLYVNYIIKY